MNYTKYKIEDIATRIGSGATPYRSNPNYWTNGTIFWLKTEQVGNYEIYETSEKITKEALEETSVKLVEENTIALAMYGDGVTRGKVSIIKTPMTTNQACCNIKVNEELANYKYVYYYLKKSYNQLRNLSTGVRKNLNGEIIKKFNIYLPDVDIQNKIVSEISPFDDKVLINNKLILLLEEYAQTLFQKWFVDLNFPNEDGEPYKDSGGEMIDVDGKLIPKKWGNNSIGNMISKSITGEWGEDEHSNQLSEALCIRGADFPSWIKGEISATPRRFIDLDKRQEKSLKHGDVIIEISGGSPTQSTGRTIVIRDSVLKTIEHKVFCSNFTKILRPKEEIYSSYLYFTLTRLFKQGVFFHYEGKTTGLKNLLLPSFLNRFILPIPETEILSTFEVTIGPILDKINLLGRENEYLQETRDLRIHKLIH